MKKEKIIKSIVNEIEKNNKIAIFHHVRIDGDSLSSSYGLAFAIKSKYPNKEVYVAGDYKEIQSQFWYLKLNKSFFKKVINGSFLAIVGDCDVKDRIANYDVFEKATTKIVFDHHENKINFAADIFWWEPSYIASSIQAYFIVEALKIDFNEQIALNLVFGIITDSGRFKYSAAQTLPLKIAIKMFKLIKDETMRNLYAKMEKRTLTDLKFQSWVFENLKIKEKVAYVVVMKKDQEKFHKTPDQSSEVNLIGNIENTKVWLMFVQYPNFIRVELRSNDIAVNKIATQFSGGGHILAAGCILKSVNQINDVITAAIKAIKDSEKNKKLLK